MSPYPDVWPKRHHATDCDGSLYRQRVTVTVDVLGRKGNGGIVAHEYRCNREWAGCPARVLVAERALRLIAADAIDERPPGPRQPNGNCVVTGPGSGGTP